MRAPRRHKTERGYTMLLVLAIVLVLTAGAATLYMMTENRRLTFEVMNRGLLAKSRAQLGVQDAIAQLRAGIPLGTLSSCSPEPDLVSCAGIYSTYNFPTTGDPQYRVRIFNRVVNSKSSVVVDSTGYSGAASSPNQITARYEAEVQTAVIVSGFGNCVNGGC